MILRVAIENFKAIHKKAEIPFQPFAVFIGNNGSGKSSVMEALRTLQKAVNGGLDEAFREWGGLDKIRNYNAEKNSEINTISNVKFQPFKISIEASLEGKIYRYDVSININQEGIYYLVEFERLTCDNEIIFVANSLNGAQGEVIFHKSIFGNNQKNIYTANRLWLGYQPAYMSDE